jgi:hypothetical protein
MQPASAFGLQENPIAKMSVSLAVLMAEKRSLVTEFLFELRVLSTAKALKLVKFHQSRW